MNEKRTYIVDIDGTVCKSHSGMDYSKAEPIWPVIDRIAQLHTEGNRIVLFTARGMKTYKGNLMALELKVRPVLTTWLERYKVQYHELILAKPWGENVTYVDDKAIRPDEFIQGKTPEDLFTL